MPLYAFHMLNQILQAANHCTKPQVGPAIGPEEAHPVRASGPSEASKSPCMLFCAIRHEN